MSRNRTYTIQDVETLFRISEVTPASRQRTGHTAARHIVLSNSDLTMRYRRKDRDEAPTLITAFATGPQAVMAVTEAINSPIGRAALAHLEADCAEGDRVTIQMNVAPFGVRYAFGPETGMVRSASMRGVTVVLERREGTVSYGIHLVTAFPAFEFRPDDENHPGHAGWQDKRGNWASV